jgi:hypothetical protein
VTLATSSRIRGRAILQEFTTRRGEQQISPFSGVKGTEGEDGFLRLGVAKACIELIISHCCPRGDDGARSRADR